MNTVENKIAAWIKIILNQKSCPSCFKTYSSKTVICEVFEALRTRATVLAPKKSTPMYARTASFNRLVHCKSSVKTYEAVYSLRIMCECGNYCCLDIPNQP